MEYNQVKPEIKKIHLRNVLSIRRSSGSSGGVPRLSSKE